MLSNEIRVKVKELAELNRNYEAEQLLNILPGVIELEKALKYAKRFAKRDEACDVKYIDNVLNEDE